METQYVEKRDGGYWIAGTRVSLDSIVIAFLEGLSPETIVAECFPVLTLEQVYGALTYYLAHQTKIALTCETLTPNLKHCEKQRGMPILNSTKS